MGKIKIMRGIEKGAGDKRIRYEVGDASTRLKLEKEFGKKVIAHWIKTGVLWLEPEKGGADGR